MKKHILFLILLLVSVNIKGQIERLTPDDLKNSSIFGREVTASGNWAAVSAPGQDTDIYFKAGAVYIFYYEDGAWNYHSKVLPNDITDLKYFGQSILLKNNRLFVGAPGDFIKGPFSGAVYYYELVNSTWKFVQKISASDGLAAQYFGSMINTNNNTLAIGAYLANGAVLKSGAVYIYKFANGKWEETQKLFDPAGTQNQMFGHDIDFQSDGTIAISATKADGNKSKTGAVYIFQYLSDKYILSKKLFAANGDTGDLFGHSVAIDDNKLAVGCHLNSINSKIMGSVFTYGFINNDWVEKEIITNVYNPKDYFGFDVAIAGDYLLVGAPNYSISDIGNIGSAFLFKHDGSEWNALDEIKLNGEKPYDYFGSSVFLDSANIIVGARLNGDTDKGAAYISKLYSLTGDTLLTPSYYELYQNYPNPFNPTTTIRYAVKENNNVKLEIFNILGQRIKTIINEYKQAGEYSFVFNAGGLASGVYIYRIESGTYVNSKKMIILK